MNLLQPKDIIAILVILCFVFLKYAGVDSSIDTAFTVVVGYYFMDKLLNKPPQPGAPTV